MLFELRPPTTTTTLGVADAMGGYQDRVRYRQRTSLALLGHAKAACVQPGEDLLVVDQFTVNGDILGLANFFDQSEGVAHTEANSKHVCFDHVHASASLYNGLVGLADSFRTILLTTPC